MQFQIDIDEDVRDEYKQILPLLTCDEKVLFNYESETKIEKYFKWKEYFLKSNENINSKYIITNIFTINVVYYD